MTRDVLKKIEGTVYETSLEHKMKTRKRFLQRGLEQDARNVQLSIAGYVQALRDYGVITERERQILYLYYGTL